MASVSTLPNPHVGSHRLHPLHTRLHLGAFHVRGRDGNRNTVRPAFKEWFGSFSSSKSHSKPTDETSTDISGSTSSSASGTGSSTTSAPTVSAAQARRPRDFLEARQLSIYALLDSDEYVFDIPSYQRPYSWQTKQVFELLQDFLSAYNAKDEYFLGGIVTTKTQEGADVPYQVIDGQQRLTSLFIMLGYLHAWAKETHNDVLEQRLRRMLYVEANPLAPGSRGRFRLQLRDADDAFFKANMLETFLPTRYQLSGVAGQQQAEGSAAGAEAEDAKPLENESWWRLYENANFLSVQLRKLLDNGLNLQDFMLHCLRNCYIVLMTARDESASFRIFSTLNGRGMDLCPVDKLKADLLQVLGTEERTHFADAWAESENILGRSTFHRIFDYMKSTASVMEPEVANLSVLEYFTRKLHEPSTVRQIIQVALDYARILLQLRQSRFSGPTFQAAGQPVLTPKDAYRLMHDIDQAASSANAPQDAFREIKEGGPKADSTETADSPLQPTDQQVPTESGTDISSQHSPDSILPDTARDSFKEITEVNRDDDAALTAQRLGRPAPPDTDATIGGISMAQDVSSHAHSSSNSTSHLLRMLEAQARYMNIFSDDSWVPATLEFFMQVEDMELRLQFLQAAEALQLFLELEGDEALKTNRWHAVSKQLLARPLQPSAVLAALALDASDRAAFRARLDSKDLAATAEQRTLAHLLLRAEGVAPTSTAGSAGSQTDEPSVQFQSLRVEKVVPQNPPEGSLWRKTKVQVMGPAAAHASSMYSGGQQAEAAAGQQLHGQESSSSSTSYTEAKYWYEVQRMFHHGKLGNLILLPLTAAGAHSVASADFDAKAAFYRHCGVEALLPRFSGAVVSGKYAQYKFNFDECRERHADILQRLCDVYQL